MLKGINFREFLSDHKEWHAFVEGFCDGFCVWKVRYPMSDELKESTSKEHHYYNGGRVVGFIGLVWFWIGVYKAVT